MNNTDKLNEMNTAETNGKKAGKIKKALAVLLAASALTVCAGTAASASSVKCIKQQVNDIVINSRDTAAAAAAKKNNKNIYTVVVQSGYLALRTAPAYDYRNEIGKLYTGDTVKVINKNNSQYWWVYSKKLNLSGYVNKDYLVR